MRVSIYDHDFVQLALALSIVACVALPTCSTMPIPIAWCQRTWQCISQRPTLSILKRRITWPLDGTWTVSLRRAVCVENFCAW